MNYQRIYNQIIKRAKNRQLEGYKEKHHIIPKCLGGNNDKENLVELTAKEHFLCHMLLCEFYPKEYKLKYALFLMAIGKQSKNSYKINSKTYERLKLEYSQMLQGKKRSQKTKTKISKSLTGKKHSKESKLKMSESRKGHKMYTEEWKQKIKKSLTGLKRTEESKLKISNGLKGRISKTKKIVLQYDKQNNFIKEHISVTEAAQSLNKKSGSAITEVCNNKRKSIFGYIWKYKN
jgi:hypothetical protein